MKKISLYRVAVAATINVLLAQNPLHAMVLHETLTEALREQKPIPIVDFYLEQNLGCSHEKRLSFLPTPEQEFLYAIYFNRVSTMVALLKQHGTNLINAQDKHGITPAMTCVQFNRLKLLQTLVKNPVCDVNIKNKSGESVLILVVKTGAEKMLKTLLERPDLELNARDQLGQTALMHAVIQGHKTIVELLLSDVLCDANLVSGIGLDALGYAVLMKRKEIEEIVTTRKAPACTEAPFT